MKKPFPVILAVVVIFILTWSVYLIFDSRESRDHNHIAVVPQTGRSIILPVGRISVNSSSVKQIINTSAVVDKSLAEQFEIEPQNAVWAASTENATPRRLSDTKDIRHIEIICKTSVCKITGEFQGINSGQIDKVLEEIRSAANFKESDNSSSNVNDNTVYKIVRADPLTIKFSNYSKW